RLLDTARAATATDVEALHDDRLTYIGFGDDQRIDVEVMVVFCVRNCGLERLLNRIGDPLTRERQIGKSRIHLLAADHARNKVQLLRADAQRTGNSLRFVVLELTGSFSLAHRYFLFDFLSAP